MDYTYMTDEVKTQVLANRIFQYEQQHYENSLALKEMEALGQDGFGKRVEMDNIEKLITLLKEDLPALDNEPSD